MGIPHLISTLEPYATTNLLRDEKIVIDGPALAYQILHVCRVNGINQPSYGVLGSSAIAWLDQLKNHRNSIQAIYFDGYLPFSKRNVRMTRAIKTTTRINSAFSRNPQGCTKSQVEGFEHDQVDVFRNGQPQSRSILDPSFFVPAIIDSLLSCSRYRALTHVVPGEADVYCARDVAECGGLVLTSDSDLLAHRLGFGQVVFLRDIYQNVDGELSCAFFCPSRICENLGLQSGANLTRLAYERQCSPDSSLAQIVKASLQHPLDEKHYQEFLEPYQTIECLSPSERTDNTIRCLRGLDPRVSEFVVQLHYLQQVSKGSDEAIKIFLPALLENPSRGSAWEPSSFLRQLGYTACRQRSPASHAVVQEYRRVQSQDQKGRTVGFMESVAAEELSADIVKWMTRMRKLHKGYDSTCWLMIYLVVNIEGCQKQDKQAYALRMLQHPHNELKSEKQSLISWDLLHLVAELQAAFYSLRMLSQMLCSHLTNDPENPLRLKLIPLREILSLLPPLTESPSAQDVLFFVANADQLGVIAKLQEFVDVSELSPHPSYTEARKAIVEKKHKNKKPNALAVAKPPRKQSANSQGTATRNIFNLLSVDQ